MRNVVLLRSHAEKPVRIARSISASSRKRYQATSQYSSLGQLSMNVENLDKNEQIKAFLSRSLSFNQSRIKQRRNTLENHIIASPGKPLLRKRSSLSGYTKNENYFRYCDLVFCVMRLF